MMQLRFNGKAPPGLATLDAAAAAVAAAAAGSGRYETPRALGSVLREASSCGKDSFTHSH
jgi:hypothetical protein